MKVLLDLGVQYQNIKYQRKPVRLWKPYKPILFGFSNNNY